MIDSANPVTVTSHCHGVKYGFKLEGRTGPEPNRSDRACPGNMISERGCHGLVKCLSIVYNVSVAKMAYRFANNSTECASPREREKLIPKLIPPYLIHENRVVDTFSVSFITKLRPNPRNGSL